MSKGKRKVLGFLVCMIFLFAGALLIKNTGVFSDYRDGVIWLFYGFAVTNGLEHMKDIFIARKP